MPRTCQALWRQLEIRADIFLVCLDHFLCPALTPGDGVVMDNLSSHKVDGVQQRIEAAGADLLYLPPYSPDLNPIEKAWAKFQHLLRSDKARTGKRERHDSKYLLSVRTCALPHSRGASGEKRKENLIA